MALPKTLSEKHNQLMREHRKIRVDMEMYILSWEATALMPHERERLSKQQ